MPRGKYDHYKIRDSKRSTKVKEKISKTMKTLRKLVGNPMSGRKNPKTPEWIEKVRQATLGQKRPELSKKRLGKLNPSWKGGFPKCIHCGKGLKHRKSKRCIPCSNLRKNNWPDRSKYEHNGFCFRSSWEKSLAEKLDKLDIKWLYESRTFDLGKRKTYTPDFYLVDSDSYIEVKGRWTTLGRFKYSKFKRKYPGVKIILLDSKEKILNYGGSL